MMHMIKTVTEDTKQGFLRQRTPRHQPRLRAAQSVSRADSANCPLPRPVRSPKSVPDTVFPSRRAECHETYPALAYLTDKVRVIECRDRLQWILQCRRSVAFIAALMDSGVEFVAVDNPHDVFPRPRRL